MGDAMFYKANNRESVPEILNGCPRGKKERNGLLTKHFSLSDAQKWFESRGVLLKTESDGRKVVSCDR